MANQEKIIERIQRLMSVAENTPFPEEAETAMRQANKLIMKHAISEAMLNSAKEAEQGRHPGVDVSYFTAAAPHSKMKALLATRLGKMLGVSIVVELNGGEYDMTAYGSKSDMEMLWMLYASVARFGVAELRKVKKDTGRSGQVFGNSFWSAYAVRVIERAEEAYAEAMSEVHEELTGKMSSEEAQEMIKSTEVALRNQLERAEEERNRQHPNLRSTRVSTRGDWQGYAHGRDAAERADIPIRRRLG